MGTLRSVVLVAAVAGCSHREAMVVRTAPPAPNAAPTNDEAELHAPGDPRALVADALAARARGDEAAARRNFAHARVLAETNGLHGQVVPAEDYTIAHSSGSSSAMPWSSDGRYVVYERSASSVHGLLVVDTHTWTSLRIDHGADPVFSDDNAYLVVSDDRTVTAYELATGRVVLEPHETTLRPRFVAAGKLVWAAIDGTDDVLYLHDLAGGEIALRAPRPAKSDALSGLHDVTFVAPDRLIAWGYAHSGDIPLRVFSIPERRLLASFDSTQDTAKVVGERMYYVRAQGHASQLRFADLRDPAHEVPQPTSTNKTCGAGIFDEDTRVLACTQELVVVAHDHTACEWALSTGKLTRSWPTGPNPVAACDGKQLPVLRRGGMMPRVIPGGEVDLDIDLDPSATGGSGAAKAGDAVALDDSKQGGGFTRSPNGALIAGFVLDDVDFARAPKRDGALDPWSAITGGRPRIWNAAGKIVWTAPAPAGATEVALAGNGDVVLAARDGRIWHVANAIAPAIDARHAREPTVRTTPPPSDCALSDVGVLPDGRAAMFCRGTEDNQVLRVEGDKPLVDTPKYTSAARIATSPSGASAMIASDAGLLVYALPSGKVLWTSDAKNGVVPRHYDLNATTLAPSGDRMALYSRGTLAVVDHDTVLWQKAEDVNSPATFSPDGALLVTEPWQHGDPQVRDAATGTVVDTLPGAKGSIAFASASVVVYVRRIGELTTGDATLVVRDVKAKRELATHSIPRSIAAYVESVAAGATGASSTTIAAVNPAGIALVWGADRAPDQAPLASIAVGGSAAAITARDGTLRLLGDASAARAHFACRIGDVLFPLEVCESGAARP